MNATMGDLSKSLQALESSIAMAAMKKRKYNQAELVPGFPWQEFETNPLVEDDDLSNYVFVAPSHTAVSPQ
jgi:hypothetical protein